MKDFFVPSSLEDCLFCDTKLVVRDRNVPSLSLKLSNTDYFFSRLYMRNEWGGGGRYFWPISFKNNPSVSVIFEH